MRRLRRNDGGVDAAQLRNADPEAWLSPAERIRIVELVDDARARWAVDRDAPTELDKLAPVARLPTRIDDNRERAIALTEKLVVSYRRSLAGWKYAAATGLDGASVAAEFALVGAPQPPGRGSPALDCGGPADMTRADVVAHALVVVVPVLLIVAALAAG